MTDFDSPDRLKADQQDRLIDLSLRELLAGENPPDLTDRILSAAHEDEPAVTVSSGRGRSTWFSPTTMVQWGVIAATLLIGAVTLVRFLNSSRQPENLAQLAESDLQGQDPVVAGARIVEMPPANQPIDVGNKWTYQERKSQSNVIGHAATAPKQRLASSSETLGAAPGESLTGTHTRAGGPTTLGDAGLHRGGAYGLRGERMSTDPLRGRNELRFPEPTTRRDRLQMMVTPHVIVQEEKAEGLGPGMSGDEYVRIVDNPFVETIGPGAVSTFSIDVDTASYANVRQFLMQSRMLPPPDAVRIEELINYFDYSYPGPTDDRPFAATVEVARAPWNTQHQLVRVALKGREPESDAPRPLSNLVFLVDVSGSMDQPNKLPLVVEGLRYLTCELGENDRVAIVVYAGSEGLALDSTPGTEQQAITGALDNLRAGGSTAGGAGIRLAYQVATENFIQGGVNRVLLCTDGDFNVGTTSTAELERLAETQAQETGVFLTVLGFGRGNLNDAMMEAISNKGNGNYHYIDNEREARKVLVEEMSGTLVTIAKDVKIQVEFNPLKVAGYRLIGYENRKLARQDFDDDTKDAGEIGAGHTVTSLYELVPAGQEVAATTPEPLKYQNESRPSETAAGDELLTVRLRYKEPAGDTSTKIEFPVLAVDRPFAEATTDFQFTAAVASFGMILRDSEFRGEATFDSVLEILDQTGAESTDAYRAEFAELVRQARSLSQLK